MKRKLVHQQHLYLILVLVISGCNAGETQTVLPTSTLPPVVENVATLAPEGTVGTSTPVPTATLAVQAQTDLVLPGSLYFLSSSDSSPLAGRLYRLVSGDASPTSITPEEHKVTGFDVSMESGTVAYGTESGHVYLLEPGKAPILLVDAAQGNPVPMTVRGMAWSPDGTRLAYTVRYATIVSEGVADGATSAAGLWTVTKDGNPAVQLLQIPYAKSPPMEAIRAFDNPVWSPDGTAMLITAVYFEWANVMILDPARPGVNADSLWAPEGGYGSAFWSSDSQSVYYSGKMMASTSDIIRVGRSHREIQKIMDGQINALYMNAFAETPDGIYLMSGKSDETTWAPALLGPNADGFLALQQLFPEREGCSLNAAWAFRLFPGTNLAFSRCSGATSLISTDGEKEVDLMPYLGDFAQEAWYEVKWGPALK